MFSKYYEQVNSEQNNVTPTEHTSLYKNTMEGINSTQKWCKLFLRKLSDLFLCILFGNLIIVIFLVVLYVVVIFLGLLVVFLNNVFENTMVFLVGKDSYRRNFPTSSETMYNDFTGCYTTNKTYCL